MKIKREEPRRLVCATRTTSHTPDLFANIFGAQTPMHVGHSDDDTSKAAALSVVATAPTNRARVLAFFVAAGEHGATTEEAERALGFTHQACSPRVIELAKLGMIEACGAYRPTSSGRAARVYVATSYGIFVNERDAKEREKSR